MLDSIDHEVFLKHSNHTQFRLLSKFETVIRIEVLMTVKPVTDANVQIVFISPLD